MLENLASIIENHKMFEKNAIWIKLFKDQISWKKIYNYFLLFLGAIFSAPSQCSFLKLQLQATKNHTIVIAVLYFFLHQLKKCGSDF